MPGPATYNPAMRPTSGGWIGTRLNKPRPFNPASIANLVLFLQYDAAHCTSSTPGQPVSAVSASYGTTRTASAAGGARPTFRANGLEYDGSASQFMDLSSALVLNGAFTSYHVFNTPAGADCIPVGSVLGKGFFGLISGELLVFNDAEASTSLPTSSTGILLARLSRTAGDDLTIDITGAAPSTGSFSGDITLDCIGATPGNTAFSGSTANRSLCDIIKTGDNSGTQENTDTLAWLFANYTAAL